ncbi:MAG: hypothetical protein ACFB6S_18230 [Geminicoccaceae bacterium]
MNAFEILAWLRELELWSQGCCETRTMAVFLAEPKDLTPDLAARLFGLKR